MESKSLSVVDNSIVELFERMEPRHIALLMAKVLNPDTSMTDISKELWPDLSPQRRKEIVAESQLTKILVLIRQKPWVLTKIMAGKVGPVALATLFELSQTADKDNVRVTAAKELIRLAQSTANQIVVDDGELEGVAALDSELVSSSVLLPGDTGEDEAEEEALLSEEDIIPA